jgi:pantetheine-phosphate adenylyltransferase
MPGITAVFPGSFDPITSGHIDVITRGSKLFRNLIVGVARNPAKKPLFSVEERVGQITELLKSMDNVTVESFEGMTVDFVKSRGADVILRGIRSYSDFEYEFQLALANRSFANVETVFIMASTENSFVRSTMIKEAAAMGADISRFVPDEIIKQMNDRLTENDKNNSGLRGDDKL